MKLENLGKIGKNVIARYIMGKDGETCLLGKNVLHPSTVIT